MVSKIKKIRFKRTIDFINKSESVPTTLLDLGTPNLLSRLLSQKGFEVQNTYIDLDEKPRQLSKFQADATTAFEILEHLVNPLSVLRNLNTNRLFTTIPLSLWFSKPYYNPNDPWDRHFHEFEDWQFDWLLEKGGWEIIRREKWNGPLFKPGFRPFLRLIYPRYYAVEAERRKDFTNPKK